MRVAAIIPARMASTRFPGKPLALINGRPMIEHVYRRVCCSRIIDGVYVATCDMEIDREVLGFGGKAVMTSMLHKRGTDRVAEAARGIDADVVINIQGDEPMVDPVMLDEAAAFMLRRDEIRCMNLITPINDSRSFASRDVVKAAVGKSGRILYFSRQPIPTCKGEDMGMAFKQIGIYLVRRDLLMDFPGWQESPLEEAEQVDMLRFLENGAPVHAYLSKDMIGVDTPGDVAIVQRALMKDPLYLRLFGEPRGQRRNEDYIR